MSSYHSSNLCSGVSGPQDGKVCWLPFPFRVALLPALLSLVKCRMETLDEFDNEYPLNMSFCKLISPEDFEVQSLSYTEQCLQELYTNMEQSPGICERVMRKRKQIEKEEAGLASFLKVPAVPFPGQQFTPNI